MNSTIGRLGEMLRAENLISEQDLQRALDFQQRFGGKLGAVLIRMGSLSEDILLQTLSKQLDMPVLEGKDMPFDVAPFLQVIESSGIERDWWLDQEVVAWENGLDTIALARDPLNDSIQEVFAAVFGGRRVIWHLARTQDLERALDNLSKTDSDTALHYADDDVSHLRELAEGAPVVELVNNLLSQATDQHASDVHIEPEEQRFFVRYRVDGVLREHMSLPKERFPAIASRIKLIAGLDIAERRLPQDGRLNTRVSGQSMDIRVSALPGVHGESIVMRLLPKERETARLAQLGMEPDHLELFQHWINEPHGIVLVTGPTGSGKSTTLYAALDAVNDRKQKIITVEDPVEYQLQGVTQVQAHADIGYSFSHALRSILRQDPDIIMIGEIRDQETAEIAVQASLTGHLVLSTLHTNDAVSAFTRLIDMGIEPFLVSSSVRAVQAQRLIRRLCEHCAQPTQPPQNIDNATRSLLSAMYTEMSGQWKTASGCSHCGNIGYKGRSGIYELVYITPELQERVIHRAPTIDLRRLAAKEGFRTMRQDGWIKAWRGLTSLEEVLRVTEEQDKEI